MNETTERLIRELAEKLGTTSGHLWEVMVRQAWISGVANLVVGLILVGIMVWSGFWLRRRWREEECHWEDLEDILLVVWSLSCCLVLAAIVAFTEITLAAFFNPEGWVLLRFLR